MVRLMGGSYDCLLGGEGGELAKPDLWEKEGSLGRLPV